MGDEPAPGPQRCKPRRVCDDYSIDTRPERRDEEDVRMTCGLVCQLDAGGFADAAQRVAALRWAGDIVAPSARG